MDACVQTLAIGFFPLLQMTVSAAQKIFLAFVVFMIETMY